MKSFNKKIIIVGDRILIRPDKGESKSPAGLYLPPSVLEKQEVRSGVVVEVGPGNSLSFLAEGEVAGSDGVWSSPWECWGRENIDALWSGKDE